MAQINCRNKACDHILAGEVNYCPYCGTDQRLQTPDQTASNTFDSHSNSSASHSCFDSGSNGETAFHTNKPEAEHGTTQTYTLASIAAVAHGQTNTQQTSSQQLSSQQAKEEPSISSGGTVSDRLQGLKQNILVSGLRKLLRPFWHALLLVVRGVRLSLVLVVATVLLSAGIIMTYLFLTQDKERKVVSSTRITMPTPPPKPVAESPLVLRPKVTKPLQEQTSPVVPESSFNQSADVTVALQNDPSSPWAPVDTVIEDELLVAPAAGEGAGGQENAPATLPLRVTTNLAAGQAVIRIMNIAPVYHDGIALTPGQYDIMVTAPGHKSVRQWITLSPEATEFAFYLSPLKAITVTNLPEGAYALNDKGERQPLPYPIPVNDRSLVEFTVTAPGYYPQFMSVDSTKNQTVMGHLRPIQCGVLRQQSENFSSMGRTTFDLGRLPSARVVHHIYQSWKQFENGRTRVSTDGHIVTMREYNTSSDQQYIDHSALVYDVYGSTRVDLVSAMKGHTPVLDRLDLKAGARLFCTMIKGA